MKKFRAVALSVLYYVCVFGLCAFVALKSFIMGVFTLGYPLLVVGYFVLTNRRFYHDLELSRWAFWFCLNIFGFILSVVLLTLVYPMIWFNFMIGVILLPALLVFAALWVAVGIGMLFWGQ